MKRPSAQPPGERRDRPSVPALPAEAVLFGPEAAVPAGGRALGRSREGRPVIGFQLGKGPWHVSLIGGCHADEPVGPAMLLRLVTWLQAQSADAPWVKAFSWWIVPHVNPDGARRNRAWSERTTASKDHLGSADRCYDLAPYVAHAVRETPGDDIEFGFPRTESDRHARPENRAVAAFLSPGAPFHLHASFHGMAFAPGPWFLIEPAWVTRTRTLRRALRGTVATMGYQLFDVDRQGEKGFTRIDRGFSTRPDSVAMARFFSERGNEDMAARFRPSSMEFVRSLGGDPFTFVSEMPLFLLPTGDRVAGGPPPWIPGLSGKEDFQRWLGELLADESGAGERAERVGLRAMPIRDQMRLQLAFLDEALRAVSAGAA